MAATAGGVSSPAGEAAPPQIVPAGAPGPPMVPRSDVKPIFMAPTNPVRQESIAPGVQLVPRPPLGSPPSSGPSPLFPPQAPLGSHPRTQAGAPVMPRFPPSRLPTSTTGAPPFLGPPPSNGPPNQPPHCSSILPPPPSSHPHTTHPGLPQRPPSFPPPILPPGMPPPAVSTPFPSQNTAPPQIAHNDPNARALGPPLGPPLGHPPPQFRPPPGPPLSGVPPNLPPPRGPPPMTLPPPHPQSPESAGHQMPPPPPPGGRFPPLSSPGDQATIPLSTLSPAHPHTPTSSHTPSPSGYTPPLATGAPLLPSPQQQIQHQQQQQQQQAKSDVVQGEAEGGRDGAMEVWYEHKIPDGRVYFSHSVTRNTTWDRPQNAVIKPHPTQQAPPRSIPASPNASHLVPTRVWAEFQTPEGKPYFYNKITRVSVWERPTDFDLVMPLPPELGGAPPTQQQRMPLPHPAHSPGGPRPPLMSTPPMFPPGRPPFNQGFPPGPSIMNRGPPPHLEPGFPPPTHPPPPPPSTGATGVGGPERNGDIAGETEVMEVDRDTSTSQSAGDTGESGAAASTDVATEGEGDGTTSPVVQPEPAKEELKGPRPIASVPVPGTPWSVVWTSDERQFFFDVTSRVSLWIIPEELKGNPLVENIIENGPDGQDDAPLPKRVKILEDGEEEEEEEMEEEEGGGGLDIAVEGQTVETVETVQAEGLDAEKKAAMIRSGKTLEERQEEFKEMLLERGVSAFSTWDKELPKFIFDPRYMLLNSKERRACFEEFVRSRAEEERKEKRSKLKARRDEFRKLLEDSKLHPKSSFSEFAQRHVKDDRFKGVEKMREREQLFTEYLQELKKTVSVARGKHKTTEQHSSSAHTKPDKVKADFMEMLSEQKGLSGGSQWRKVKGGMERDPRYRAVPGGSTQREEWFREYVRSLATSRSRKQSDPSQEREERIQASLKEREREVQMSRSAQEKEWGRERDQLRRSEVLQQFKAMLADMIRSIGVSWSDARRQLRQDPRWSSTSLLEAEEKEKLYQEHCDLLVERKRLQFRRLLEDTPQISLVMPWKKARKLIRDDPRYKNFTESDHRREAEYDKHLRDKMVTAKNEFRGLLKETRIISYKSHELVRESEKHYKEIIQVLEKDQRYLVLECVEEERARILEDFMHDLHRKGPPPPPTASNPSERLRK